MKRLCIAFNFGMLLLASSVAIFSILAYFLDSSLLSGMSWEALFWGQRIVKPFLEPHFHGETGMLDGPYRMILWLLSIVLESIVYTIFFYLLIGWRRKRSLKAAPQLQ
jgi:hypothetical protein